ncbi:MAG: 50S ribosomal protein L10 [Alphaproteobacteria bacterium]|nr:50S ribosomal protein L10 [Alphaproteobacteria bacterium]
MDRLQKKQLVETLSGEFKKCPLLVVTRQTGLTVAEVTALRVKVRQAGAFFKVTKNSLTKIALKDTQHADLSDFFQGPTAIAFSEDPIAAAKVIVEFAKTNDKIKVVAAGLSGKMLDEASVKALAALPSLDELRSKLLGLILAPATKIVGVLNAPGTQVARVLSAYAEKGNNS